MLSPLRCRVSLSLVFWLLLTVFGLSAHAQSSAPEVQSYCAGKSLFLRGLWAKDDLRFDAQGHLKRNVSTGPFTLSGFDLQEVKMAGNAMRLTGVRVGLAGKDLHRQTVLVFVPGSSPGVPEKVTITIDKPPTGDYAVPLAEIFSDGWQPLSAQFPTLWQRYASAHGGLTPPEPPQESPAAKLKRIGGAVTAPVLLSQVAPEFSKAARASKVHGNVLLNVVIGIDGTPARISVVRPGGMGLDEKAEEAVLQYRFRPATQNGVPVAVELNIDVNFQLF